MAQIYILRGLAVKMPLDHRGLLQYPERDIKGPAVEDPHDHRGLLHCPERDIKRPAVVDSPDHQGLLPCPGKGHMLDRNCFGARENIFVDWRGLCLSGF